MFTQDDSDANSGVRLGGCGQIVEQAIGRPEIWNLTSSAAIIDGLIQQFKNTDKDGRAWGLD